MLSPMASRSVRALATGLLLSTASAQLVIRPSFSNANDDINPKEGSSPPIVSYLSSQGSLQKPLSGHEPNGEDQIPPFKAGQFTLTPQSNETCATYGETQWTGTIDVTDEHRLFFWYFDSRGDPGNDPIIIWLNGGPGGSSMMGMLNEIGPCWLPPGEVKTTPNEYAWNNNASLLFIDQPAGVGFSSLAEGASTPKADMDGAQDFQEFLNLFFGRVFPDKARLPIHLAAESYGGHYAPTYVDHIIKSREYDSRFAFWGNITSLILVNAVVDFTASSVGAYELLCSDFRGGDIVNATACESIRQNVPECENLGRTCALSYDPWECFAMWTFCQDTIDSWYWKQVELGLRNPFNIHIGCPNPPVCLDQRKGNFSRYLNQEHIKAALEFPPSYTFSEINFAINDAYTDHRTPFKPTVREIAAILDAHARPELKSDIRLLVLNGNEDYVVNTPGNVWAYDNLLWSGQPEYRITRWEPMPEDVAATGFWKGTRDGRLVFVGVDDAGHTVPGDVREGSYQIAKKWIEGGWPL